MSAGSRFALRSGWFDGSHRVDRVPTPFRLRHRRVNSLENRADVCNHQRSLVLIATVLSDGAQAAVEAMASCCP